MTNIQEAIDTDQGRETNLTISLPENIQDRDPTLKTNLEEDLTEITNAYKYLYKVAVDLKGKPLTPPQDQEEQEIFKDLCNKYFIQELDEINAQQEPIKTLAKLRQEGKQEEYHKYLQALVDEDLKKQRSDEEILAKILSTLSKDSLEYKKRLQNFVETKVTLFSTEKKLAHLVTTISIYEEELKRAEAQELDLPFRCKNWRIDIYKKFSLFSIDNHQIS